MAKRELPEGIDYAEKKHQESSYITENVILKRAIKNGDNIVFPILGKDKKKILGWYDELELAGYEIHLHNIELPKEKSMERVVKRYGNGGQFIDPKYVESIDFLTIKDNYAILNLDRRTKTYGNYNADVPKGQQPKFTGGSEGYDSARFGVAGGYPTGRIYQGGRQGISREKITGTETIKPTKKSEVLPAEKAGFVIPESRGGQKELLRVAVKDTLPPPTVRGGLNFRFSGGIFKYKNKTHSPGDDLSRIKAGFKSPGRFLRDFGRLKLA